MTIGAFVSSAQDSMVISCPSPNDWSNKNRPKMSAMMPGQIIEREPRAKTNTIAATVSWVSWLLAINIPSPFLLALGGKLRAVFLVAFIEYLVRRPK
jgi:hypothetical protein